MQGSENIDRGNWPNSNPFPCSTLSLTPTSSNGDCANDIAKFLPTNSPLLHDEKLGQKVSVIVHRLTPTSHTKDQHAAKNIEVVDLTQDGQAMEIGEMESVSAVQVHMSEEDQQHWDAITNSINDIGSNGLSPLKDDYLKTEEYFQDLLRICNLDPTPVTYFHDNGLGCEGHECPGYDEGDTTTICPKKVFYENLNLKNCI